MNHDTYERYYRAYFKKVKAFFLNRGFCLEDAHELTQDVFLRVYKNRHQFKGVNELSFAAWLQSIVESIWKNKLRSMDTQKRAAQTTSLGELMELPTKEENPLSELMEEERVGPLREAVRKLTEPMRTCLIIRIYHQKKYSEIAVLLKLPLSQVKNLLHNAREQVKEELSST